MTAVVRTAYAAHLGTCKLLNLPYIPLANSTLNQKYNLFADEVHNLNEYPRLAYIGIGNKGVNYEVTSDNFVLTDVIPHSPRHASLYNFIPFLMREVGNDIPANERVKYRLRVPTTIGGVDYVAYYLRYLNIDNIIPTVELRSVDNGNKTTTEFIPTATDLSPEEPNLSNINLNDPSGDYIIPTAKIRFTLNETDIAEIRAACEIIYNNPRYAIINEIAICTGVDKTLQGLFGAVTSNYTDCITTQVAAFIAQHHNLTEYTTEINIDLEIGSSEALLVS